MESPRARKRTLRQDLNLIFDCLILAAKDLFKPQFLFTILAIPAFALLGFLVFLFIFWNPLRDFFFEIISDSSFSSGLIWSLSWLLQDPSTILSFLVFILTLAFFLPLGFVFVAIIFSVITPVFILTRVHRLHYPELQRQHSISIIKSVANSLLASFLYLFFCILILPTFFVPPLFIVLGHLLTSSLHSKIFSYDVISEFVSSENLKEIRRVYKTLFFRMGIISCLILYIPFLNLVGIVFVALAFTHLGLKIIVDDECL